MTSSAIIYFLDRVWIEYGYFIQGKSAHALADRFGENGVRPREFRAHHLHADRIDDRYALGFTLFKVTAQLLMMIEMFVDVADHHPVGASAAFFPAMV